MTDFEKNFIALTILVIGIAIGLICRRTEYIETTIVQRDTTVVVDTHIVERPVPVRVTVTDTLLKEVTDTVRINDTLYVSLPLERKEYRRDEFYAVVYGYNPSLIHMEVYPKTVYVTETQRETVSQRNYLSAGVEMLYAESFHSYIYLEYERMLHRNVSFSFKALHDIPTQSNGVSIGIKAQIGW
jgi:hypothetical protein